MARRGGGWLTRAGLLAGVVLVLVVDPSAAEEPLGDLVRYPPGHTETRRGPVGNEQFYRQEAGVDPGEIEEEVSAIAGGSDQSILVVRGTRFVSAAAAETAALSLATRPVGRVRDLGSLGDGWIVTIDVRELAGSRSYVHDGFRLRGRDLCSFVAVTSDPAVPAELLEHMAWHAATYPGGSTREVPAVGPSPLRQVGLVTAVAVAIALLVVSLVASRSTTARGSRRPARLLSSGGRSGRRDRTADITTAGGPPPASGRRTW